MAQNIIKLIRALKTDESSNAYWWNILGSIEEAKVIVAESFKESPTSEDIVYLKELLDINSSGINTDVFKECLKELRKELIQIES